MVISAMTVGMAQAVEALNSSEEAWRAAKQIEEKKEEWDMCLETIIVEESKDEQILLQWQRAKVFIDKIWMGRGGDINGVIDEVFGLDLSSTPMIHDDDDDVDTSGLIALGRTEEEPLVRGEALKVLSEREEGAATQALARLLQDEPQVKLRRAAIEVLAQRPLNNELIILLSAITTSDPDIMLRAYALSLLGG